MSPRRYKAQVEAIQRELQKTLARMRATALRVSQDYETGECEIRFDRSGKRYVFRCRKWADPTDNFRAAQRAITLLYQAVEEAGVVHNEARLAETFGQFFAGWAATLDDATLALPPGAANWWAILGVSQGASVEEIRNAFKALAFVHHPDHGGEPAAFRRVRDAYEAGMAARKAAP